MGLLHYITVNHFQSDNLFEYFIRKAWQTVYLLVDKIPNMFRINLNITFSYIPKLLQWCKFSLINQVYVLSVYLRIVIDILRQAYYTASSFVCCLRYHTRPTYIRTAFIILLYIVNRYSGICFMKNITGGVI